MQKHHDPSAFLTSSTGVENEDVLSRMTPYSNMVAHCRSNSSFCSCGYR
jgi:hypothetical protein